MLLCAAGLSRVKTSMVLDDLFPEDNRIVQDYRWLERHVGPLFPAEIVLRVEEPCSLSMNDKLRLVLSVEQAVRETVNGGVAISAATFSIRPATGGGLRDTVRRSLVNRRLMENREQLVAAKYLADGEAAELWRITVRQPSLTDQRYGELLQELRQAVDTTLANEWAGRLEGVSVVYTGLLPLVASSQWELLRGLLVSFGVSMFLIALMLAFGLRDARLGLLSILPNFFPILVVFGAMGWIGKAIDVGSMMTASVGLGIAVDDTVHFLTWFQRGLSEGRSRSRAILSAYQRCGTAMLETSIICSSGLVLLSASSFGPAARFGGIICLLLGAALLGDLLFLPALLAGPVGRRLFPQPPSRAESTSPASVSQPEEQRVG
jgi:predicted RND superfamily exporter protein